MEHPTVTHNEQPIAADMLQTDEAGTLRRLWRRSLLVMMCVTSVSFRPWAMAVGPRVA